MIAFQSLLFQRTLSKPSLFNLSLLSGWPKRRDGAHSKRFAKFGTTHKLREAFGLRPACRRFCLLAGDTPTTGFKQPTKAAASCTHSRRFARFGCGFGALWLRCALA